MVNLSSAEIKQRIANKQIKLNDAPIPIDIWRTLKLETVEPLGNFISNHPECNAILRLGKIYDVDCLADCNSPKLQKIFKGKAILRISKKDVFVINC